MMKNKGVNRKLSRRGGGMVISKGTKIGALEIKIFKDPVFELINVLIIKIDRLNYYNK